MGFRVLQEVDNELLDSFLSWSSHPLEGEKMIRGGKMAEGKHKYRGMV